MRVRRTGSVYKRAGLELVVMGGVGMCSAHIHEQGRGCVGSRLVGIPLQSGLFWLGSWNDLIIAKHLHQCLKKAH